MVSKIIWLLLSIGNDYPHGCVLMSYLQGSWPWPGRDGCLQHGQDSVESRGGIGEGPAKTGAQGEVFFFYWENHAKTLGKLGKPW